MAKHKDLLTRLGPPEGWMLSEDDILHVMLSGPCEHLIVPLDRCRECFVAALVRRQMAVLAQRLGCPPDVADDVAESLVRKDRTRRASATAEGEDGLR
jgi:hypothetical protein